jgi:hypothetical protein
MVMAAMIVTFMVRVMGFFGARVVHRLVFWGVKGLLSYSANKGVILLKIIKI